jgi:hypothetical protein
MYPNEKIQRIEAYPAYGKGWFYCFWEGGFHQVDINKSHIFYNPVGLQGCFIERRFLFSLI